jgi:hypothetical protein
VGPIKLLNTPGIDHAKVAEFLLLTKAMDTQTCWVGTAGTTVTHPLGGVPVFVWKFHDPPVGVAGGVLD